MIKFIEDKKESKVIDQLIPLNNSNPLLKAKEVRQTQKKIGTVANLGLLGTGVRLVGGMGLRSTERILVSHLAALCSKIYLFTAYVVNSIEIEPILR